MNSIAPIPSAPVEQETFDASLRRRAKKVIPGGLWGHMNAAPLPEGYPQFFARARGCRLWDVDDNEYVHFMCSYGPTFLGYGDEDVERAAARQRAEADIANGPAPCAVAELVVATVAHADWVIFAKNGTDATTTCVTLARASTGRRKVLVARGSYHGAVPSCTPSLASVTAEDRAHLLHFDYNESPAWKWRWTRPATISRRSWWRRSAMTCGATRSCRPWSSREQPVRCAIARMRR